MGVDAEVQNGEDKKEEQESLQLEGLVIGKHYGDKNEEQPSG